MRPALVAVSRDTDDPAETDVVEAVLDTVRRRLSDVEVIRAWGDPVSPALDQVMSQPGRPAGSHERSPSWLLPPAPRWPRSLAVTVSSRSWSFVDTGRGSGHSPTPRSRRPDRDVRATPKVSEV